MKHSFKYKRATLKNVFSKKLSINNVSIENGEDVKNLIYTLLSFIELENTLIPSNCSYNFLNNQVSFQLKLEESKEKTDFFESIKKFESFIES